MEVKEFLPNPIGKDAAGEYIALFNNEKISVTMTGWKLTNSAGKAFRLDHYTAAPGETRRFAYVDTRLALKNTGETVSLYDAHGTLIDSLAYRGTAVEGRVITSGAGLTAEARDKLFTRLPENYPQSAREAFYSSPLVFMVLLGAICGGFAIWFMKQTKENG